MKSDKEKIAVAVGLSLIILPMFAIAIEILSLLGCNIHYSVWLAVASLSIGAGISILSSIESDR